MIHNKPFVRLNPKLLEVAGIPKRYWLYQLSGVCCEKTRDELQAQVDLTRQFILDGSGLLIMGDFATGKTAFACILLRVAIQFGADVVFVRACEIMSGWRNQSFNTAVPGVSLETRVKTADLVLVDDLGAEIGQYQSGDRLVEYLFRSRHENKQATIATTNLSANRLHKEYREAFFSVLKRSMTSELIVRNKRFQEVQG